MISIKEYLQNYKFLEIINTDGIGEIDNFLEKMVIQTNGVKINYDYPLGVKNYFAFTKEHTYCLIIKEDKKIKGFATFSIQRILIDGAIQPVCYVGDFSTSPELSPEGKRQWQNAFSAIIKDKDRITEFSDCKYFYALILKENSTHEGILERLSRSISIKKSTEYKIINIFAKKYPVLSRPPAELTCASLSELEEIRTFLAKQKIGKEKDINIILDKDIIENQILKKNCYLTRDDEGKLLAVINCKENDLKRVHIQKMDNIFKMAGTLLPLFGRSKIKEGDTLNSLYFDIFEVTQDLTPLERSELACSIIASLLKEERYTDCSLFTIPCYGDRYLESAAKNFFSIESILIETIFKKKEIRKLEAISKSDELTQSDQEAG
ncbi:hypothetical protein [Bacteriovorax sp. Seq25_V]|uniref:hypothetical protein n=1 Tax=Bacteriovorax sp. Seq25_V TaxID=1201288 RepID=UPI00038A5292|nr:hypothetical protein [Bacteriovorax sp. Seq25_V]EQC48026.1 hypothetical protein M900_1106 [Bacteriovorax sp. Seq25_V]